MSINQGIERLSSTEIINFQNEALVKQIKYISEKSIFYKRLFKIHNINADEIRCIDDLKHIPFTQKDDLQKFQRDFYCVETNKIIDYAATSGTQGKPVTIPQTDNDLKRLAYNEAKSLTCASGSEEDIYQLTTTINKQFMAGLAYFLGIREMGAGIIRVGSGAIPLQWQTILSMKPTALIVIPSFLVKMIEYAENKNIDTRNTSIKKAICIGEPIRHSNFELNSLGKRIKESMNIDLYSTYASTEMATAFTECWAGNGGHHQPDLIITEFVDENDNPVKDGEPGELVITTLGLEAFPLLRFKTGDICVKHSEKCKCGRNSYRLGPVIGRNNQMIKFKGTTLYPPALFDVLNGFDWISSFHIQLQSDSYGCDEITINVNEIKRQNIEILKEEFKSRLRVTPNIKLMNVEELNKIIFREGHRKPVTFSDLRTIK